MDDVRGQWERERESVWENERMRERERERTCMIVKEQKKWEEHAGKPNERERETAKLWKYVFLIIERKNDLLICMRVRIAESLCVSIK